MGSRLRLARHTMQCHVLLFGHVAAVTLHATTQADCTTVQSQSSDASSHNSSNEFRCSSCSFEGHSWKYSMRSSAPLFFCLCGVVVHGASVAPHTMAPWRQAVLQTETTLRKDCGEECVKVELAMGCGMRPSHVSSNRFCTTCWLRQSCTTQRRAVNYNTI